MDAKRLIDQLAKERGVDTEIARELVSALLEGVAQRLAHGEEVAFPGFGKFAIKRIPPWLGPHPETREMVMLPGKNLPYFQSEPSLRKQVNDGVDWKDIPPKPVKRR